MAHNAGTAKAKKRLVVLCDGTWNRADQVHDGRLCPTNVAQLAELVVRDEVAGPSGSGTVVQRAKYHKGVGTGRFNRLLGGATGLGLGKHVREVYTWLGENYDPGDEIFLFGFSRGAYTARSAVGMIRACGLIERDAHGKVDTSLVNEAYGVYRGVPPDEPGKPGPDYPRAKKFRDEHAVEDETHIRFIGVWDTVGALGIPLSGARFSRFNKRYEFHNVNLSSRVQAAYQALAIDEHRGPFVPAVWQQSPDRAKKDMKLEQAWFPGAHSDVGGGYGDHGLSDLTLRWMVARARAEGLVVDTTYVPAKDDDQNVLRSAVHNSRSWIYQRIRPYDRAIGVVDPEHESICITSRTRVESTRDWTDPGYPYKPAGLLSYLAGVRLSNLDPDVDPPGGGDREAAAEGATGGDPREDAATARDVPPSSAPARAT